MKSESDLTKLARWIIPGWIGILSFYAFVIIDIQFTILAKDRIFGSIPVFFNSFDAFNTAVSALLIAASGIPLGFVIYQAYFFLRWNSPFSRDGFFPPFITGRMNDLNRLTRYFSLDDLSGNIQWRNNWIKNPFAKRDHGFRWRYIELLFTEAAQKLDTTKSNVSLYGRHRYLHEVIHTLGASVGAVYSGFFGYLFIKFDHLQDLKHEINFPAYLIATTISVLILFFLLNKEDQAKQNFENSLELSMQETQDPVGALEINLNYFQKYIPLKKISIVSPGSLFLFTIATIHIFGNPKLFGSANNSDIILRIVFVFLIVLIWLYSKARCSFEIILGDAIWLHSSFLFGICLRVIPTSYMLWIDWPFLTVLFTFLMANLILLQNRRNAGDDMIALEYYTLRRYLDKYKLDDYESILDWDNETK